MQEYDLIEAHMLGAKQYKSLPLEPQERMLLFVSGNSIVTRRRSESLPRGGVVRSRISNFCFLMKTPEQDSYNFIYNLPSIRPLVLLDATGDGVPIIRIRRQWLVANQFDSNHQWLNRGQQEKKQWNGR